MTTTATAPLWRMHSDRVNLGLIDRWLPGGDAVLKTDLYDETVSAGLCDELRERYARVVGIDIDPAIVAAAADSNPALELHVADVRDLPFGSAEFEAVVSNSTLDHFDGPGEFDEALYELCRVTAPGGLLVLTLDNGLNPMIALRNRLPIRLSAALRGGFPYPPGWTTGPRGVAERLGSSGFEVMELTTVSHAPRALVALSRREAAGDSRRLGALGAVEGLGRLPTGVLSGHFVAALARKPA